MKTSEKVQEALNGPISACGLRRILVSVSHCSGISEVAIASCSIIPLELPRNLATYWEKNHNNLGGEIHEK